MSQVKMVALTEVTLSGVPKEVVVEGSARPVVVNAAQIETAETRQVLTQEGKAIDLMRAEFTSGHVRFYMEQPTLLLEMTDS